MNALTTFRQKRRIATCLIILALSAITIGLIIACGKLSDDTEQPGNPPGPTGGVPLPVGKPDSLGTHSLSLRSKVSHIPADMTNYTVLLANLTDSSGRSVEDFLVTFDTTPTSDAIGFFRPIEYPPQPETFVTTITARTNREGQVSVRLYGIRSGSCVVEARVDIDQDGVDDLFKTVQVQFTSAGPPYMAGGYLLELEADPDTIPADGASYSVVTATLTDTTGGVVENFLISFTEMTALGQFEGSITTYSGLTDQYGQVPVRFFGLQSGRALIQARVFVNDTIGYLERTVPIRITAGPGVPGPEIGGVFLTASPYSQNINVGTCGEDCAEASFTVYADVWDEDGYKVGAGVRVEFYNGSTLIGYSQTDSSGRATATVISPSLCPQTASGTSWSATIRAEAYFNNQTYTDEVSLLATATCTAPTPVPPPTLTVTAANPIISEITLPAANPTSTTLQACTSDTAVNVPITFTLSATAPAGCALTPASPATTELTDATGCTAAAAVTLGGCTAAGNAAVTVAASGYTGSSTTVVVTDP